MMKLFLATLFIYFLVPLNQGAIDPITELKPCPFSPNCVSSQETSLFKKMEPIQYDGSRDSAAAQLETVLLAYPNAILIEHNGNYYHYEFQTSLGKFIDDVEFLINDVEKRIHFRSASRIGFGDFGKNRRRMKAIRKAFVLLKPVN